MDETEQKVKAARVQLLLRYPFYGMLLLGLEETWDEEMPTCGVNPYEIIYNRNWLKKLSLEETIGVMAHEAAHLGLLHPLRRRDREPRPFNVACDFVVNLLLSEDTSLRLPQPVLFDSRFKGMTAEQVYEMLRKEGEDRDGGKSGGKGTGESKGESKGEKSQGKGTEGGGGQSSHGNFDDHSPWDKLTEEQKAVAERELRDTVVRAALVAKAAGRLPGRWDELVTEMTRPQVDWRSLFRNFVVGSVKTNYRLMPPNKRHLWRGIYLPSLYGEHLEIAVAIDTSGSIGHQELAAFNTELKGLCDSFESYRLHYFQCDAVIQVEKELENGDTLPTSMRGRGGTSYRPVFEKVWTLREVSCLVYLTDLYPNDGYPEPLDVPVLWISSTDRVAPFGQTIRIEVGEGRNGRR